LVRKYGSTGKIAIGGLPSMGITKPANHRFYLLNNID
jgi:hypothetical protein